MENQNDYAVVLFLNTQSALRAEHILQTEGIRGRLVPAPRRTNTDCGLAFRFSALERSRVLTVLDRSGLCYGDICAL